MREDTKKNLRDHAASFMVGFAGPYNRLRRRYAKLAMPEGTEEKSLTRTFGGIAAGAAIGGVILGAASLAHAMIYVQKPPEGAELMPLHEDKAGACDGMTLGRNRKTGARVLIRPKGCIIMPSFTK